METDIPCQNWQQLATVPMARKHFRIKRYHDQNRPKLKYVVGSHVFGKRERRFFETEGEAKTYADQREIELLNVGTDGVTFPIQLRATVQRAVSKLAEYGRTIDDAVAFYLKHLETERGSIPVRQAVGELIDNRRSAGLSKVYCGDLQFRLGRFVNTFGERTVASVATKEVDAWLESLGVGPVTRNTFRRDVRTLFSFCVKRNYCAENPAAAAQRAKEQRREVEVLGVDDVRRLLAAASPDLLPYWAIGLFAGLRVVEVHHLQWSDVDFEDALITARSSKTGRKRFVKMQPNLVEWLKPYRGSQGAVVDLVNLRRATAEDRKAAGLDEWPVNALRHSFGSYWLAQFSDINGLAVQMGNSPEVIERHYRKAVRPKDAHRYWAISPTTVQDNQERKIAARIG